MITTMRLSAACLLLCALGLSTSAEAKKKKDEKPLQGDDFEQTDNVAIARMLFSDGFYDRAAATLDEVDPEDEAVDVSEFWLLRGLVAMRRGRAAEAAEYFGESIKAGNTEPKVWLLRAQTQVQSRDFDGAAETFDEAPDVVYTFPEAFILEAQVLYKLERLHESFEVLDAGFRVYPENEDIERQRLLVLIELGLFQRARTAARSFFERRQTQPQDWIALAQAMSESGQHDQAVLLLEEANFRFPGVPEVRSQLAAVYLNQERPVTAAEVLRPLAWTDAEKSIFAAELYKRGGQYERAIGMNQRALNQKEKFRQRLSILLDQEKFELAANLYPRLARLGLLEEQPILYALAFAFFQTREFDKAERLLSQITDPELFRQGIAIRQAIEGCRQDPTKC